MNDLNNVPKTGTFGNAVDEINSNFELVETAISQLESRTSKFAGFFQDAAALQATVPSPTVGMWADVGSTKIIYRCNTAGIWTETEETDSISASVNYSTIDNLTSTSTTNPLSAKQGKVLNDALTSLKAAGYVFAGVTSPSASISAPSEKVYYIAPAGTYTNFGSSYTVQTGNIGVFSYNGSWSKTSMQCLDYATVESPETIIEYNGDTGWQTLVHPLNAGLYTVTWYSYISVSGTLMLSNNGDKTAYLITLKGSANQKNNLVYIPKNADIDCYACQVSGTKVGLRKISESDLSSNLIAQEADRISSPVQGYVNNAGTSFVSASNWDWAYFTLSATVGHTYLIPYSWMKGSVSPIVGLDNSGNIVKTYSIGNQQNKVGYIVFKADTPKIGLTMRTLIGSIGSSINIDDLICLPYWDLTTSKGDALFNFIKDNNQLFTDLFPFTTTEISSYDSGYYNKNGNLITSSVGSWKYSEISVTAGSWYLINTNINTNTRIVDIDDEDNTSVNASVPVGYYDYASNSNMSWVLVKAATSKIGVSFDWPATNWNPVQKHLPRYVKLERTNNNGLIFLFVQLYASLNEKKGHRTYIVRKAGGGDYTSLVEAVLDNVGAWGVTLHLDEGTYDVIQELTDYYGTSDFLSQTLHGRGLEIGYDMTIEGSPNALIVANYTGSDVDMLKEFSPLNCNKSAHVGGMTLRGVNIRCSNVRYCVHDEKGQGGVGTYNNLYENCNFYIDNTDNTEWHSSQCIGGGLGKNGSIIVRNCIFEEIEPNSPTNAAVSYHNCASSGAKSMITCTGNYIKGARGFRFSWYGDSTEITEVICSNNNVGRETQYRAETQDTSPNQNVTLYDFGNIVRS